MDCLISFEAKTWERQDFSGGGRTCLCPALSHLHAVQRSISLCTKELLGQPSIETTSSSSNLVWRLNIRGNQTKIWEQEREHERAENKTEMEDRARQRGIYEVRGADIWTDTVQQTGSYEDIWRIHEAVMNLFDFFYRSAGVSLMDKVGAGKHISVMARHCRKNKLNSLLAFHTLSTPFSLSPTITHFLPLWFSVFVFLFSQSFFVLPSLSLS